jgi:hypothetical protein
MTGSPLPGEGQLPLFAELEPAEPPSQDKPASRKPHWTRISGTRPPCDECKAQQASGARTAVAATARWRRTRGGTELLLCAQHAEPLRTRDDHSWGEH